MLRTRPETTGVTTKAIPPFFKDFRICSMMALSAVDVVGKISSEDFNESLFLIRKGGCETTKSYLFSFVGSNSKISPNERL